MSISSSQGLTLEPAQVAASASSIPLSVRVTKQTIDIFFAVVGLLLLSPLLALLALAIYIDSPGPILYRQRRASLLLGRGPDGRCRFEPFWMLKFRSMRVDAEAKTGAVLAGENDPRVTRMGRLLRTTRLDEIPQLWNVLNGEMSLVGPRPERPELLENLTLAIPFFEERMRGCKPGITGLAQVSLTYTGRAPAGSPLSNLQNALGNPYGFDEARGALADDMRTKLLFDLGYVAALEHFTTFIRTELWIILRTPYVMLRGLGR